MGYFVVNLCELFFYLSVVSHRELLAAQYCSVTKIHIAYLCKTIPIRLASPFVTEQADGNASYARYFH